MKRCYTISYDLRGERNYDPLYKAIKSYNTWAHILESTWAIVTDQSAVEIRDYLMSFLDEDDGIFIVKSGVEAAWKGVECSDDWLKRNL